VAEGACWCTIPPKHLTGETVKTTRFFLILLAVLVCAPSLGLAQSNAKPDYKHQHKSAEKYQKSLMKQQRKQQKADAKRAKAYRKQHQ
jgi:hypothetical protein